MTYRHFTMLVRNLDKLERDRAYYTALAFNDPSKLLDNGEGTENDATALDLSEPSGLAEFAAMMNG